MAQLIYKKRKYPVVCLGDMIHRITIYDRTIVAPEVDGNYDLDFKKKITVWAMCETTAGQVIFDSVNLDKTVTHNFTIRYLPFLTQEHWILYKNNSYDIVKIENMQEEDRFQILYCNIKGSIAKKVTQA